MIRMPLIDVMVGNACELRCVGCTNGIGLLPMSLFPADEVERDVTLAAGVLRADVAVILGGEPLMHRDLIRLIHSTRESGIADRVRVLTNGIKLEKQPAEFFEAIDDLRVSIYPGKTPPEAVDHARQMAAAYGFELSFYDVASDPFRAVHTHEARSDQSAQETWDDCWYRSNTRKLEQGYFWRCCTSAHLSKTVLGLEPHVDGLALDGITEDALAEYLDRSVFMDSCRRCHGNTGPVLAEWSEIRDRGEWLAGSCR